MELNLVGNYIALGLVAILALFYFERRYFPTLASKFFAASLIATAVTAIFDTFGGILINMGDKAPLWLNMTVNSIFFISNILTTSLMAMILFAKILEHVHDDHCMIRAKIAISSLFISYFILTIVNITTGIFFYFEDGFYKRGPLNSLGYLFVGVQMALVMVCYFRHKQFATKTMKRVLLQSFPIAILCIVIQLLLPDVLLNAIIMSLVCLVMYLNFQNRRPGVHSITDLNDRYRFFKFIEDSLAMEKGFRTYVIRIRNFDTINQKYGHKVGDEALYLLAFSLERIIKESTVFHMNNMRFALVVPYSADVTEEECYEKIRDFFKRGIDYYDDTFYFEYTLVEHPEMTGTNATDIYEALEYGIDVAEERGLKHFVYTSDLTQKLFRRKYLIRRLAKIDREHGYDVLYQPVHCMKNDIFCSMEALIRLYEPDGTTISPAEFIPIAEQAEMINPITWFVIEESCKAISENPALNFVNISINLPMTQIFEPNFIETINAITDKYGVKHHQICLEFTERAIMSDFENAKATMDRIAAEGYRFFLDDFGMGYSNFNCLLKLPFKNVKLDRALTTTVNGRDKAGNIVYMLTELFHRMDLKVIAEGVETEEQMKILYEFGVDRIQGYYYAKPMKLPDVIKFYEENPHTFYI